MGKKILKEFNLSISRNPFLSRAGFDQNGFIAVLDAPFEESQSLFK